MSESSGVVARTWAKFEGWLIVNRRGEMRLNKGRPTPDTGEYVFLIELKIPSQRIPVPLGTITLSLPEPGPGEVELLVSDTPVDQGGPKIHLFEPAELNPAVCARCGFSTRALAHRCVVPDCIRPADVVFHSGAIYCVAHQEQEASA